jgi:hypothetical protein
MAKMIAEVRSYSEALAYLDGKDSRKIGHNTWVENLDKCIAILYHRTYIVRYFPNGVVTLHDQGWQTVTTKQRLNCFIPSPWSVGQEKYEWFFWNHETQERSPYSDGCLVPS